MPPALRLRLLLQVKQIGVAEFEIPAAAHMVDIPFNKGKL
jgi:hypothetical protein